MYITYYDSYVVLSKVFQGGAFIKQAIADARMRETTKNASIKICYGVLDKNVTLDYIIKKLCEKSPKTPIKIILKIGLYAIKYLKTAPYAVTDACVTLCKKLGKGGAAGFVNATLRNFSENGVEFPENGVNALSVKYSYPEFAAELLIADYGNAVAENIMSADEEKTFVRFNKGVNGEEYLEKAGKTYFKTPFSNLYEVKNFVVDDGFYDGLYTFQSIGSVAIAEAAKGKGKLLDVCAAPGGKSVYLSDYYDEVLSLDIHPHRVELIKAYAERMKKNNVTAALNDGTVFNPSFYEKFDAVLCDAPCSGFGVIKENPDIKINRKREDIDNLSELQYKILSVSANYVKSGGMLVYSTCSVFQKENSSVAERFLKNHGDFYITDVKSELGYYKVGIGLQFLPHISYGAGFYLAVFKKK